MKKYNFKELFSEADRNSITYHVEGAVLDFTEDMVAQMEARGISRSELARRIGTSPAYITKILRGTTNFTLESMVKVALALDCEFKCQLKPKAAEKPAHMWIQEFEPCHATHFKSMFSERLPLGLGHETAANQEIEDDSLAAVA